MGLNPKWSRRRSSLWPVLPTYVGLNLSLGQNRVLQSEVLPTYVGLNPARSVGSLKRWWVLLTYVGLNPDRRIGRPVLLLVFTHLRGFESQIPELDLPLRRRFYPFTWVWILRDAKDVPWSELFYPLTWVWILMVEWKTDGLPPVLPTYVGLNPWSDIRRSISRTVLPTYVGLNPIKFVCRSFTHLRGFESSQMEKQIEYSERFTHLRGFESL